MKKPTRQTDRHVEAVLAALDVLECFLAKPGLGTPEIMQATGFTRNRVMRLTGTLAHRGYLMTDPGTGVFCTGPKIFALGKVFERNRLVLTLVRPILRDIALKTGESASLYVREGFERVVMALFRHHGFTPATWQLAQPARSEDSLRLMDPWQPAHSFRLWAVVWHPTQLAGAVARCMAVCRLTNLPSLEPCRVWHLAQASMEAWWQARQVSDWPSCAL